jgi:hypothetical protein
MFFLTRLAEFRNANCVTQLDKENKKFFEDAKGVPRKFDRPPLGLQLLREFSSSPRRKVNFKK